MPEAGHPPKSKYTVFTDNEEFKKLYEERGHTVKTYQQKVGHRLGWALYSNKGLNFKEEIKQAFSGIVEQLDSLGVDWIVLETNIQIDNTDSYMHLTFTRPIPSF